MAKHIQGFLAGTSYAPAADTDEALFNLGCQLVAQAGVSSAIVLLDDGTVMVGHPAFVLEKAPAELLVRIIRQRLLEDDFATRSVRAEIRGRLRDLEGKSEREQHTILGKLLQDFAECFLVAPSPRATPRERKAA